MAILLGSCTDPTTLGSSLLEQDKANIEFTDTLSLVSYTVQGDSVRTYSPFFLNQLQNYLCGSFQDPVFGLTTASIYIQPILEDINPDFSDTRLDSIILVLPYDTNGLYGNIGQTYDLEVYRITGDFSNFQEYYSNNSFATESTPLGRRTFTPSLDSIEVLSYSIGAPDTLRFPHLRIPLDLKLGQDILNLDSLTLSSDSLFLSFFKGVQIRPAQPTEGMLSFNLQSLLGGIFLYYTKSDTLKRQFGLQLNEFAGRTVHFDHQYTGSRVKPFLDNPELGDSLIFLQGMAGVNGKIEIPNIGQLKNTIINKAELIITVADLEGDNPALYPPARQVLAAAPQEEGDDLFINDILFSGSNLNIIYDGLLNEKTSPGTYSMNITAHLQAMVNGERPNVLLLTAAPITNRSNLFTLSTSQKPESARRVVLYGANHPVYGIQLRVTYTKL